MAKRGRPAKPGGSSEWVPPELKKIFKALKKGDRITAAIEFGRWNAALDEQEKKMSDRLDTQNKPDVN